MIQHTTYHPDTCSCVIDEGHDMSLPDAQQVAFLHSFVVVCPEHAAIVDDVQRYETFKEENTRKNQVYALAYNNWEPAPGERWGTGDFGWRLTGTSPNRTVEFWDRSGDLTTQIRSAWQQAADIAFGPGKVSILATPPPGEV